MVNRPGILSNTTWMLASTLVNTGANFLVFVVIARYLGASDFGSFSYVFALASLFSMMGQMGLDGLLSRELVEDRTRHPEILGTAGMIQLVGYASGMALTFLYGALMPGHSSLEQQLFTVAALFVFANVLTSLPENWLKTMHEARSAAKARIWGGLLGGGLKVIAVLAGGGVILISVMHLASLLITAGVLHHYFRACGGPEIRLLRISLPRARLLLGESWRLVVSALLWIAYMRIDLILLHWLSDSESVGQYAIATRLAEVTYALPSALIIATFPAIMAARERGQEEYRSRLQALLHVLSLTGILAMIACWIFAVTAIKPLFGSEFSPSISITVIYMMSTPFFFMHYALTRWILIERMTLFGMINDMVGVMIKLGLSIILISRFGAAGAAAGTVISYACIAWLSLLTTRRGRDLFVMMSLSFLKPWRGVPILAERFKFKGRSA